MKKLLILMSCLIIVGNIGFAVTSIDKLSDVEKKEIKNIISEYKKGSYLTCISKLKEFTKNKDDVSVAWYYLGNAYMKAAMTKEANEAFNRVIQLNDIPRLTAYAVQAQLCLSNPVGCKYEIFEDSDVSKLVADPQNFIQEYHAAQEVVEPVEVVKSPEVIEIENLINGVYENNIHPQALEFINSEQIKMNSAQIQTERN